MTISFPGSPTDGQIYSPGAPAPDYQYSSAIGAWQVHASAGYPTANGSFLLAFGGGAIVANGTYALIDEAPFPLKLTGLRYQVGTASGSFNVAVNNAGSVVTALSAVAVSSSTRATATPTGNATVTLGSRVEVVISSVSGSPTGATLQLNFTKA